MSSYDYQCPVCGKIEEVIQGILEEDRYIECPQCRIPLQKVVVNNFSFSFKDGFNTRSK